MPKNFRSRNTEFHIADFLDYLKKLLSVRCLLDPGPDIVICDEGHLLKNEKSALNKAVNRIRTLRRIILTGTPLQNNLKEYYEMVNFVKPNLLGTRKEFMNRFVNPISNGQHSDSTERDIRMMKQRSFVLYDLLKVSCPPRVLSLFCSVADLFPHLFYPELTSCFGSGFD
jgi:hypothetical protein